MGEGRPRKDSLAVVLDFAGLAMHQMRRSHNIASEGRANRLMAQADSQQRYFAGKMANQRNRDSGFLRRAGARREQDPFRVHGFNFRGRDLIIAAHLDLSRLALPDIAPGCR